MMSKLYYDKTKIMFRHIFWVERNNKFKQAGTEIWNEINNKDIWIKDVLIIIYD